MKSFATAIALVALIPTVLGQQMTINTPVNVVQCQPEQLSWSGGTPPYYLSLVPGGQPAAPAIKQFPTQQATSYTWDVDLQANTNFNIVLKDSTGQQAFSDMVTIQSSGNSSCISTSVTESGGTSGTATAGSGSGSSAPTGSGSVTAKPSGSSTGAAAGSAPSSSTSAKSTNAASRSTAGAFGIAGLMGLVGAALF